MYPVAPVINTLTASITPRYAQFNCEARVQPEVVVGQHHVDPRSGLRPGGCGHDDLGTRVHDIARGEHAGHACGPHHVDCDEIAHHRLGALRTECAQDRIVGVHREGATDKDRRTRDHTAVGQPHAHQPIILDDGTGNLTLDDRNTASRKLSRSSELSSVMR